MNRSSYRSVMSERDRLTRRRIVKVDGKRKREGRNLESEAGALIRQCLSAKYSGKLQSSKVGAVKRLGYGQMRTDG